MHNSVDWHYTVPLTFNMVPPLIARILLLLGDGHTDSDYSDPSRQIKPPLPLPRISYLSLSLTKPHIVEKLTEPT